MLKTLDHQINKFRSIYLFHIGVICPYFHLFNAFFLYVSLICNHNNQKVTSIDKIFLQIVCEDDMLQLKQYLSPIVELFQANLEFSEDY